MSRIFNLSSERGGKRAGQGLIGMTVIISEFMEGRVMILNELRNNWCLWQSVCFQTMTKVETLILKKYQGFC